MGLYISPGGACWAYGGFMRFREELAHEEGLELRDMKGFGGEQDWWLSDGETHRTPLAPLLNHSDCDGYLEPYECEEILLRLPAILDRWEALQGDDIARQYDVEHGRKLVDALRHSVEHGCAVRFR